MNELEKAVRELLTDEENEQVDEVLEELMSDRPEVLVSPHKA